MVLRGGLELKKREKSKAKEEEKGKRGEKVGIF